MSSSNKTQQYDEGFVMGGESNKHLLFWCVVNEQSVEVERVGEDVISNVVASNRQRVVIYCVFTLHSHLQIQIGFRWLARSGGITTG